MAKMGLESILMAGVALCLAGCAIGLQIADYRVRRDEERRRASQWEDQKKVAEEIRSVHNGLVEQVSRLGEQVQAHEFKLTGAGRAQATTRNLGASASI